MSVRQIILLRHAHAEPPAGEQTDDSRPLTEGGIHEADAAAAWLKSHGAQPDVLVCSPSLRTRETAARIIDGLGGSLSVTIDGRVYEATPGDLIQVLEEHADADCVLLIGHNPGLETLVALLTDGTSDHGRGMPPGAIAWLHVDGDATIEPGAASLRHFWWP
ncbi:MAG TPA: histidine phosphatase family protein [Dokdonella sp.]|uniref:SixA phosphatase family protein n=1 Tax=Dokdonella sp. TaxID=2291710 RepID=UPI002CB26545|nr:histidine phosphatase family protein [Dokdonella sp.]HOX72857.1 histidine phosphatase family protein [Dokdonella sp.]HPG93755.1 histidine phosphatase family protein [Dokdonella sp.]HPN79395.1 histidine phosphatase family protein [Dokdonella sp.]